MGYQVQTDEAGHEFTLVDPRQQTFDDSAKRQRYAEYLERSYQIADRNLKEIIEAAKLSKTNIIAVSDHGMAPMHTQAFPNRILRAADLLSVTRHWRRRPGQELDKCRDGRRGRQYLH